MVAQIVTISLIIWVSGTLLISFYTVPFLCIIPVLGEFNTPVIIHFVLFSSFVFMALFCFYKLNITPPGVAPSDYINADSETSAILPALPVKGESSVTTPVVRNFCMFCQREKPPRCHHCSMCNRCILKMDHHCPYAIECIGFRNYKYFFQFLFYLFFSAVYALFFFYHRYSSALIQNTSFLDYTFLSIVLVPCILTVIGVGALLAFHIQLIRRNMTTLEYYDAYFSYRPPGIEYHNPYDLDDVFSNFIQVFGRNPLFWFLPFHSTDGDGVSFITTESSQ